MEKFIKTNDLPEKYVIEFFVPGVAKEDLSVTIDNQTLRVVTQDYCSIEYNYKIYLPKHLDYDKITAKCEKGMLYVTIPKNYKKIEVE